MFSMKDLKDLDLKDLRKLKNIDKDDLLDMMGLQTKSTTSDMVGVLAAFGVGVLVGAGVGLLLAPKSGREIRDDLRNRLQGVQGELTDQISNAAGRVAQGAEKPTNARPL